MTKLENYMEELDEYRVNLANIISDLVEEFQKIDQKITDVSLLTSELDLDDDY